MLDGRVESRGAAALAVLVVVRPFGRSRCRAPLLSCEGDEIPPYEDGRRFVAMLLLALLDPLVVALLAVLSSLIVLPWITPPAPLPPPPRKGGFCCFPPACAAAPIVFALDEEDVDEADCDW